MKKKCLTMASATACLIALGLSSGAALAEPRALLVGVGNYDRPNLDLPGIDLDLVRVRDTLKVMGFTDAQIRSLADSQATSENVIKEMSTWLRDGVGPDDRVVFYFSGHGSNTPDLNGDEEDGVDEVLVTYDVRRAVIDGRRGLTGVVTDDKIAELIGAIPSRNILMMVDACHSGTVSRGFELENKKLTSDEVFEKMYSYPGMPESGEFDMSGDYQHAKMGNECVCDEDMKTRSVETAAPNFVAISAAGDGEKAIGTSKGGVFTVGFTNAITAAASEGRPLTVSQARDAAAAYIREVVDTSRVHNPQITGSPQLAGSSLSVVPQTAGYGPQWQRIEELAGKGEHILINLDEPTYALGDPINVKLVLPTEGYLNIVQVDASDNATVIFPNAFEGDNKVAAGEFRIDMENVGFEFFAAEPVGPTLMAAFLTATPVNFYEQTDQGRDEDGKLTVDLATLSPVSTRAIGVRQRQDEKYHAGSIEVVIK